MKPPAVPIRAMPPCAVIHGNSDYCCAVRPSLSTAPEKRFARAASVRCSGPQPKFTLVPRALRRWKRDHLRCSSLQAVPLS
jgi:hypothetical protein